MLKKLQASDRMLESKAYSEKILSGNKNYGQKEALLSSITLPQPFPQNFNNLCFTAAIIDQ
jgi:hypothetical protein